MDQLFIIRPGNGVYAMLGVALGDTSLAVERRDTYPGYVRFGVSALEDKPLHHFVSGQDDRPAPERKLYHRAKDAEY